jgi:hypothetical protein
MDEQRRSFLKKTGAAGVVALAAGASAPEPALAQGAGLGANPGSPAAPKRMTFVTLHSGDVYSLGVKTDLGILDVLKTAKFIRSPAPTTIDDLIRRGDRGLTELVKVALARRTPGFSSPRIAPSSGPCVTNPEKILCVGVNYAKHAREDGRDAAEAAGVLQQFNNALNAHRERCACRRCPPSASTTIRAGDRDGKEGPQRQRSRGALLRVRLLHRPRLHRARSVKAAASG